MSDESKTATPAADAWVVKPSGTEPLPVGPYQAGFLGVADYSNPDKGIADKWQWTWEVVTGPHKGKKATAMTDRRLTPATHPGRLLTGMLGRPLVAGEDLKAAVDGLAGQPSLIRVAPGPKGGRPSVQSADRPPE